MVFFFLGGFVHLQLFKTLTCSFRIKCIKWRIEAWKGQILQHSKHTRSPCTPLSSVQSLSHVRLFATHELQHARPPCPSPTPRVHSNSHPSIQWCHLAISSSVVPFSSCPQYFPESGSFQMSEVFPSGGQSIGVSPSASVLPMNTQDWSPSEWTGWISL